MGDIKIVCCTWSSKCFNLLGKAAITNNLIISQLTNKLANISCINPNQFLKQLYNVLYKFIWESDWERIACKALCADIQEE